MNNNPFLLSKKLNKIYFRSNDMKIKNTNYPLICGGFKAATFIFKYIGGNTSYI